MPFSICVFAKWWNTDEVVLGLGASFGPFFGRPVLICLIYAIKDELIDHFLPRFHNSDICFREKMHHEEGICRDKRIKCKRKDIVLIKTLLYYQITFYEFWAIIRYFLRRSGQLFRPKVREKYHCLIFSFKKKRKDFLWKMGIF